MGSINWSQYINEAEAAGEGVQEYTPLPADSYEVKVLEAKPRKFKNNTKDGWNVAFVVEGGPHAGRRVWTNLVVSPESPKAMGMLIRQLSALGVRPLLDSGASVEQIAAGLTGALATIKVSVGEWNGKPKNEVDAISARVDGTAGPSLPNASAAPKGPEGLPI